MVRFWEQLVKHIRRWNRWRKCNTNGKFHKILVLFGKHSPTFDSLVLTEEYYLLDCFIVDNLYFTKLEGVDLSADRIEATGMTRE